MTVITSLSLRIFPGRERTTWALTWRVQKGTRYNDRRLTWGVVPIGRQHLQSHGAVDVLERIVQQMRDRATQGSPAPAGREPLGAVGGGPLPGQGLPGIDPDE